VIRLAVRRAIFKPEAVKVASMRSRAARGSEVVSLKTA
jgi:hypothetical protein